MKAFLNIIYVLILLLAGCAEQQFSKQDTGTVRQDTKSKTLVVIGTGGLTGVYYPTGGAICRLVNRDKKKHGVYCSVESTGGSVYNISRIRTGELDMGIAQSDWQYHAYMGSGKSSFKKAGPFKNLRSIFSVYPEPVSIMARKDSGIKTVSDLVGKRVNIGNPGSGTEATWNVMWNAMGKSGSDLKLVASMRVSDASDALCDNRIDALFWLVGNPALLNRKTADACNVIFARVEGPAIDKLVADNSFFRYATIPGGMYRGNPDDIPTFGVGSTFVTTTEVPEKVVYEIVKAVFENFDSFKRLHPAFRYLKKSEMIRDSLTAPLHDGAIRYYKEAGLI
ncbi:MAG: TAXI family TRAP transporter solute-binding subunit [Gammaproteobacteria bacterium]|nr:TAXI family TRAP transporter solute-binding subunit [Gammaproteobacteria bacterium]